MQSASSPPSEIWGIPLITGRADDGKITDVETYTILGRRLFADDYEELASRETLEDARQLINECSGVFRDLVLYEGVLGPVCEPMVWS